ncbi:MAG: hypothetical protein H2B03_00450 [Nitrosopumilaceae archaeon]|uniref:Uncharacterized protein n=1 Tax=Candidatus Nitrosomaritimum aestuariumsis TaxID=3342354 RepID=A0AC60VW74_9ARCH|nr:hypothetical protein [Nitrosopumilaceae archaeon]
MLDKNPNQVFDKDLLEIKNKFSEKNLNFILSSNPFFKTEFLNKLVESADVPVVFLDFDLLYSGYVNSGIIKKNEKLEILVSNGETFIDDIKEIIRKIESKKSLIILDTLNGLYNMFDELEYVRFINSAIMLLSSVAKYSNSLIVITAMTRKNESNEYILSPTGRHLFRSKNAGFYNLITSELGLVLNVLDKTEENVRSFNIIK